MTSVEEKKIVTRLAVPDEVVKRSDLACAGTNERTTDTNVAVLPGFPKDSTTSQLIAHAERRTLYGQPEVPIVERIPDDATFGRHEHDSNPTVEGLQGSITAK